ncbi:hypothetical protein [Longirhabdus pacifica]|uniref:hypothetical protein n=1 Tax=Longirhabdus pacifica TaxID=2305227 RepID=UPI001008FAD8|nr:hypothetical protein [Longirhabdus pacifica]
MKRVGLLLLSFSLIFTVFISPIHANKETGVLSESEVKESIATVTTSEDEKDELNSILQNITFGYENGKVTMGGQLTYNENNYDLSLLGDLYPIPNGQSVLGDFESSEDFNVLLFRVKEYSSESIESEQDKTILYLILEDKQNGERIYIQQEIHADEFIALLQEANHFINENSMKDDEFQNKLLELMNVDRKSSYSINSSNSFEIEETLGTLNSEGEVFINKNNQISASSWTQITADQQNLLNLLNDIKQEPLETLNLEDYPDVPESLFKDDGLKFSPFFTNEPYGRLYAYTAESKYWSLTQLSYVSIIWRFNEASEKIEFQFSLDHGMIVEHDNFSGEMKVFRLNAPIGIENLQMAHGGLEGDHVYINMVVNGSLEGKPNVGKFVWGLIPYVNKVYNLIDSLTGTQTFPLGNEHDFEKTVEAQMIQNNGKVYRVVSNNFSGYELNSEGHYANVKGQIYSINNDWSVSSDYSALFRVNIQ